MRSGRSRNGEKHHPGPEDHHQAVVIELHDGVLYQPRPLGHEETVGLPSCAPGAPARGSQEGIGLRGREGTHLSSDRRTPALSFPASCLHSLVVPMSDFSRQKGSTNSPVDSSMALLAVTFGGAGRLGHGEATRGQGMQPKTRGVGGPLGCPRRRRSKGSAEGSPTLGG